MWPSGKTERSNIVALVAPTPQKSIYLVNIFIAPTVHLLINQSLESTGHDSTMIYPQLKLLVRIPNGAGETLTHSFPHFLHSLLPPYINLTRHHQQHFRLTC
jgi:hypothetical protein